jgi:hypothetical protein
MDRQSGQGSTRAGAASGATDWQALELQLNRTRTILQEILVHLQEVLRNLKMARNSGRGFAAGSGEEARHARNGTHDFRSRAQGTAGTNAGGSCGCGAGGGFHKTAGATGRATSFGASAGGNASAGKSQAGAGAAGSERHRTWTRAGSTDARAGAGQSRTFRTASGAEAGAEQQTRYRTSSAAGGEKARSSDSRWSWSSRHGASSARAEGAAGDFSRERFRNEGTQRNTAGSATGGERRETRYGAAGAAGAAGAGRAQAGRTAGPRRASGDFRMDSDRQSRARETARRSGMNLKCAYDILCLDYPCSVDEIKGAYRHMARLYHPDLGGDEETMKDVNVAYELAMRFCAGPRRASTAWAV